MLPLRSTSPPAAEAARALRHRAPPDCAATPAAGQLLATGTLAVGTVEVDGRPFRFTGAAEAGAGTFLFPRGLLRVQEPDGATWLADATAAVLHQAGRSYASALPVPARLDWFAVGTEALRDLALSSGVGPRGLAAGYCPAPVYLLQRLVVLALSRGTPHAAAAVEAVALGAIGQVLRRSLRPGGRAPASRSTGEDLVTRARRAVASRYRDDPTLAEIASAVGASPFHLCRAFKRGVGLTLHRYLNELRLRAALDELAVPHRDLSTLALDHGFSSHSHFTARFREVFGETPSAFRRRAASPNPLADLGRRGRRSLP